MVPKLSPDGQNWATIHLELKTTRFGTHNATNCLPEGEQSPRDHPAAPSPRLKGKGLGSSLDVGRRWEVGENEISHSIFA